jgi:hypothetical protein
MLWVLDQNFMKMAPIHRRMQHSNEFAPLLIHTGQHYDDRLSRSFFRDLGMPETDRYLGVGSGFPCRADRPGDGRHGNKFCLNFARTGSW